MTSVWDNIAPGGAPDTCIPRFYIKPVENAFKSAQEGRPIFDDVEYVEIIIPGDRMSVVDERVRAHHRERWPKVYEAFKEGAELAQTGTPLEEWTGLTRSRVEELKHFHIRTVETLANLDDAQLAKALPMDGNALREKAKRYLALAAGAAPLEAQAAEAQRLHDTIELLKSQMQEQAQELAQLKAKETKRGQGD